MRKYFYILLILLSACKKDKVVGDSIPYDLVPIQIGSTWAFHRTCYDCTGGISEMEYSIKADQIVNIDSQNWYLMKFQNLIPGTTPIYWRNDATGFYVMEYDSSHHNVFKQVYFYPVYSGNNNYEILTPMDTNSCNRHQEYDLITQPDLNVRGKIYDAFKYAFDTAYFDSSCTISGFTFSSSPVLYLSKGAGLVKSINYNFHRLYNLNDAPDSMISTKDELMYFSY